MTTQEIKLRNGKRWNRVWRGIWACLSGIFLWILSHQIAPLLYALVESNVTLASEVSALKKVIVMEHEADSVFRVITKKENDVRDKAIAFHDTQIKANADAVFAVQQNVELYRRRLNVINLTP